MNKKLRDIRDGKPDAGDCENDATDEKDIHLEMNATFTEEDNIVSKLIIFIYYLLLFSLIKWLSIKRNDNSILLNFNRRFE